MKNEISRGQLGLICFLIPMVFKTAMLPMMLAGEAGKDAWIALLPLLAVDGLQLVLVKEFADSGGFAKLREQVGSGINIAISVSIFAITVAKSAVFLGEAVGYVSTFLFYNIKDTLIYILFVPALAFVAVRGVRGIGKMAEICIWVLPLVLILGFVFGDVHLEGEYIAPVLAEGMDGVWRAVGRGLLWSCDFLPLMYMRQREGKGKVPWHLVGFGVSAMALVGIYLAFIASYGDSANMINYAFATLSAFNVVTSEIGSLEWTGVALWLAMSLVYLAMYNYCGGKAIGRLGINDKAGTVIFAVLIGFIGVFLMENFQKVENFATCGVQYAVCAMELALPAVCFGILKCKGKKAVSGCKKLEAVDEKVG